MAYFSGQGRVYIGARDEFGNPAGLTFVGNVPELKVSLSVDTIEHQEAQSGQRLPVSIFTEKLIAPSACRSSTAFTEWASLTHP